MIAERLLRDARATLQRVANGLSHEPLLHRAFGAWLSQQPPPEEVIEVLRTRPVLRSYEWVAMAALAEAAQWPSNGVALEDGISWLSAVALDRVGVPAPVTTDAIAQVALALAVKRRIYLESWFNLVLGHAPQRKEPVWASNGAHFVLGRDVPSLGSDAGLRLALESVGASTARPGDAEEVIDILVRGKLPSDPLHAIIFGRALDWLRQTSLKASPKRATADDMMALMGGVQAEFMRWNSEQGGRTQGAKSVPHSNTGYGRPLSTISTRTGDLALTRRKILFLAANPTNTTRIAVDEEARDIEQKLQAVKHRDAFEFTTRWAVRPDDLQDALLREEPSIVHFSGHGAGVPGIILHGDTDAEQKLVTANALKHLFSILQDNIRIVVLNSCYSEEQAKAIVDAVDFVVGMKDSIDDRAARLFAASFYRGLGFGRSVKTAFELGVSAIKLQGLVGDEDVPVLLVKNGIEPDQVNLIGAETLNP